MGPIEYHANGEGGTLVVPMVLQGEWKDSLEEGEDVLSSTCGNLASAIEDYLIEKGQYKPEDDGRFDSPVVLNASSDENKLPIHIACKNAEQAKDIAQFANSFAVEISDIELVTARTNARRPGNDSPPHSSL